MCNNDNNNIVLLQAQCTKLQSKIYKVPYMTSKNKINIYIKSI